MLLTFLLTIGLSGPTAAQTWSDPDLGRAVVEAAADAEHLWLRGMDGVLVRIDRRTGERTLLGRGFVDMLPDGDRLWALRGPDEYGAVIIEDLRDPSRSATLASSDDQIGMFTSGGAWPGLVTSRQLILHDAGDWREVPLAGELSPGVHVAADAEGRVYVGYARGEWGGGLRRIDPITGSVAFVTEASNELCGGRLNPDCDPVVGVFPDPSRTDCIIVGTSLAHLSLKEGEIVRVCGDRITSVFAHTVQSDPGWPLPGQTWPFDGLVQTADGWVAVSQKQYARSRSGTIEMHPTPALRDWHGLRISDEQDGILFVMSACCWGSADVPTDHRLLTVPVMRTSR